MCTSEIKFLLNRLGHQVSIKQTGGSSFQVFWHNQPTDLVMTYVHKTKERNTREKKTARENNESLGAISFHLNTYRMF